MSRPRSLESSIAGDTDYAPSHAPSWASTTEQSNSSCTSGRSSGASSYDDSVYNEVDFASAVALAAQNAGFQVNGTVVSTAPPATEQGGKTSVPQWLLDQEDDKVTNAQRHGSRTLSHQLKNAGAPYRQPSFPIYHDPPSLMAPSNRGGSRWRAVAQEDAQSRHTNSMPLGFCDKTSANGGLRQDASAHLYHGST